MESDARVCPYCGERPGAGVFCEACGRNLAAVERLPTRAEWERGGATGEEPSEPLAERCAAATAAFLAAMHAAGDPGAVEVFPKPAFRRSRHPAGWILRPVTRDPGEEDVTVHEPGLVLTIEGRFHRLEREVRGWGQRDFPRFVDTAGPEPVEMPVEGRLIAELDAVLAEHGVARAS